MERLQKILSQAGVASRRASEQLMLEGRVTVNGETIRELGTKADPAEDDIRVDGRRIKLPERHRYILLKKPRNYVTTRSDPQKRPTVIDLLGGVRVIKGTFADGSALMAVPNFARMNRGPVPPPPPPAPPPEAAVAPGPRPPRPAPTSVVWLKDA